MHSSIDLGTYIFPHIFKMLQVCIFFCPEIVVNLGKAKSLFYTLFLLRTLLSAWQIFIDFLLQTNPETYVERVIP